MSLVDPRPEGWVKAAFRLPVSVFESGLGGVFGGRLLLLHHRGRRSGRSYKTVLEVVARRERPAVWYVVAAWGARADWLQNLRSHPETTVMVGRSVVPVVADVLGSDEAATVYGRYIVERPMTARVIGRLIGVDILHGSRRTLAARMPVVALRGVSGGSDVRGAAGAMMDAGTSGPDAARAVSGRAASDGDALVAPVRTTRAQTRANYDRIAPVYQLLEGLWERRAITHGLGALDARRGESVLDVGCGPGVALVRLAGAVGSDGRALGVDLSLRMCQIADRRIRRAALTTAAFVVEADASQLPFAADSFDACFMSFTLELFDTGEIPEVLAETRRVLRVGGRIGVVALTRAGPGSVARRLYERAHEMFPRLADCRPIYPEASLARVGFDVQTSLRLSLWGLPVDVIVAVRPS
jgi:deazaflavin-dependent oxidoreductase (nitroreductase family)